MKMTLMTRRRFLATSSLTLGAPLIVPGSALGRNDAVAPSDRIVMAAIGIGPRAWGVIPWMMGEQDVQFVAVADVQKSRREKAKDIVDKRYGNTDCSMYRDMFDVLNRNDIDAVMIATGDRWHAPASMLAAEAGKDVYSEKPCALTIDLAGRLADTFRRTGRVFQAGTQRRSAPNFIQAINLARSGKLGNLRTLHASISRMRETHDWLPAQPEPDPDIVDWDRWLGPAPWRPFNQAYVDGQWRGHYDLDSGARLLDWGAHTLDLCQVANDANDTTPIEYEPIDTPSDDVIECRYANSVKLILRCKGWLGLGSCPVRFEGDEGWVETGDSRQFSVSADSLRAELRNPTTGGTFPANHVRDFFNCVKSRGRTAANVDVMRKSHVACHAAAIAWKLGRKLRFDPVNEEFIGDEEANRMRSRSARAPWAL